MRKQIILFLSILLSSVGFSQNENNDTKFIIDKLINGEEVTIIVDSKGYVYYSDTIVIRKNMDIYSLEFNGNKNRLSLEDLDHIRNFEGKMYNCCSHFGCSETCNYRIVYKNELRTIQDDGCEMDRIDSLLKSLKIEYR